MQRHTPRPQSLCDDGAFYSPASGGDVVGADVDVGDDSSDDSGDDSGVDSGVDSDDEDDQS